jgi:hypothetical protein
MAQSFVKGDSIIYIRPHNSYLVYGQAYVVLDISNGIVRIMPHGNLYSASRFILGTELTKALV